MAKQKQLKPTEAELSILRILWEHGPCTVRTVQKELSEKRETGYTTALKLLQIMYEKGLVTRDEQAHAHIYKARVKEQQTQKLILGDLLERLFDGSTTKLAIQALSMKKATPEELTEIRRLLDKLEEEA